MTSDYRYRKHRWKPSNHGHDPMTRNFSSGSSDATDQLVPFTYPASVSNNPASPALGQSEIRVAHKTRDVMEFVNVLCVFLLYLVIIFGCNTQSLVVRGQMQNL